MPERPVWLIGCGNMAGAMLQGWLASGLSPDQFQIVSLSGKSAPAGVKVHRELPQEPFGDAIVQLGFKPYHLAERGPDIAPLVGSKTTILSILGGVDLETLRAAFPAAGGIIRVMPNMPVALGRGAVGLIAEERQSAASYEIEELMTRLGLAEWIADEDVFGVVTALAGCGPAFLYRFVDALAKGSEKLGLEAGQARRLAMATVDGAAGLAAASDEDSGTLADRVASPGGATRQGLNVLDEDGALNKLVEATLAASKRRDEEMAEEARG